MPLYVKDQEVDRLAERPLHDGRGEGGMARADRPRQHRAGRRVFEPKRSAGLNGGPLVASAAPAPGAGA